MNPYVLSVLHWDKIESCLAKISSFVDFIKKIRKNPLFCQPAEEILMNIESEVSWTVSDKGLVKPLIKIGVLFWSICLNPLYLKKQAIVIKKLIVFRLQFYQ